VRCWDGSSRRSPRKGGRALACLPRTAGLRAGLSKPLGEKAVYSRQAEACPTRP
jgi:hypothetical protein